jgi:hypothetical protein
MENSAYADIVRKVASHARANGAVVTIDRRTPMVSVSDNRDHSSVWFAQGDEAAEFIQEADDAADKFDVKTVEWILYKLDSAGVLSDAGLLGGKGKAMGSSRGGRDVIHLMIDPKDGSTSKLGYTNHGPGHWQYMMADHDRNNWAQVGIIYPTKESLLADWPRVMKDMGYLSGNWPEKARKRMASGGVVAVNQHRRKAGNQFHKGRKRTKVGDYARSWPVKVRKGRGMHGATPEAADLYNALDDAGRELVLFIENDGGLYRQQGEPILKNLVRKMLKGIFSEPLAAKLYLYYVNNGAQKYVQEFGSEGQAWHALFPMAVRKQVAAYFAKAFHDNYDNGEYRHLAPKGKSKRLAGARARSRPTWRSFPGGVSQPQCECSDPGCPEHKGSETCRNRPTTIVKRIDMGTPAAKFHMCEGCASDALDSGVFA